MKSHQFQLSLAALFIAAATLPSQAAIYGTMSNFDVFNDTPIDCYGAELELEGLHIEDVYNTYPSHFDHRSIAEYVDGTTFGTRVTFTGYNFNANGYISPTVGQSTNGHTCVDTAGCEHFGFAVSAQPTATRYFWLDQNSQRVGVTPMAVPTPSWSYIPPAAGQAPVVHAEVELQQPDAVWMKVFKTEINRPVGLKELNSGNPIVPEDGAETETEWELLEDGVLSDAHDNVKDNSKAVIRRYEFFKYTGPYDDEHEATSTWNEIGDPPASEFGDFISANMVAANLVPQAIVAGDYNSDGVVDAADYVAWRHNLGSEVEVEIDGDHSGIVDDADLHVWRGHFGEHEAAGALAGPNAVPEPSALILLLLAALPMLGYRSQSTPKQNRIAVSFGV